MSKKEYLELKIKQTIALLQMDMLDDPDCAKKMIAELEKDLGEIKDE